MVRRPSWIHFYKTVFKEEEGKIGLDDALVPSQIASMLSTSLVEVLSQSASLHLF